MFEPEQDVAVQLPVVVVRRPAVVGLAAFQLVADLHEEHAAVLAADQILALLGRFVRISVLQFLGSDKVNVLGQVLGCLWVFVPHLVLHVLDDLEDLAHRLL